MKKILALMLVIISMVIFAGCSKDNEISSLQGEQQTSQNVELDMILAQFRLEKKDGNSNCKSGGFYKISWTITEYT